MEALSKCLLVLLICRERERERERERARERESEREREEINTQGSTTINTIFLLLILGHPTSEC